MQVKCPVILTCPLGAVIVADELIWGHVRHLTYYIYFELFSLLICLVSNCAHTVGGSS